MNLKNLLKKKGCEETGKECVETKTVEAENLSAQLEEIRIYLEKRNVFEAGGALVSFLKRADVQEIKASEKVIKKWLKEDVRVLYMPGAMIPYINESLWVLEQEGVTDNLRRAGILDEVVESLISDSIECGETGNVARLAKLTGRNVSQEEMKKQLLAHAHGCMHIFGRSEAAQVRELPIADQRQIIEAAIERAVSLGWWSIAQDLTKESMSESQIKRDIVDYLINKYFPELYPDKK